MGKFPAFGKSCTEFGPPRGHLKVCEIGPDFYNTIGIKILQGKALFILEIDRNVPACVSCVIKLS